MSGLNDKPVLKQWQRVRLRNNQCYIVAEPQGVTKPENYAHGLVLLNEEGWLEVQFGTDCEWDVVEVYECPASFGNYTNPQIKGLSAWKCPSTAARQQRLKALKAEIAELEKELNEQ